jgi:NAD(P)-dependent dehydrogenase (short-subunit alcohol dehydrogenase family)
MRISNTAAIVTGGSSGLGLATARRLLADGANVVLVDLPSSDGQAVADSLGESCVFAPADVTDETAVAHAVETAAALGPVRILVNCAGIVVGQRLVGRNGPMPLNDFRRVLEVNVLGTVNVTRLAIAAMLETDPIDGERGVIVNTASVAAFDGQIGQTPYSASKAAIVGLTLPLARELAESQIRVVAVAPGTFETPMMASLSPEARASLGEQVPHPRRLGRPEEFAQLIESVVTNPMLNGETIRLDGAIRMAAR